MSYERGDFGKATFIAKKGWLHPTVCYGRIIDFDNKIVEFVDNDDNEYMIPRSKFEFIKEEFKPKH